METERSPHAYSIFIVLFSFLLLGQGFASRAMADAIKKVTPRIYIQEEYNSNINQVPTNEDTDWISLISPGLSFALDSPVTRMGLNYAAELLFYQDHTYLNKTRHQGNAIWEQQFSNRLKLNMSDIFHTSEDRVWISEEQIKEVFKERQTYYSNTGQISLSYRLTRDGYLNLGYRNLYLAGDSKSFEDSVSHEGFLNSGIWFSPKFGIDLASGINRGQFKQSGEFYNEGTRDFYQYKGSLKLNYRLQNTFSLYAKYSLLDHDFEKPGRPGDTKDFLLHQAALGLGVPLSPITELNCEAGYFVQDFIKNGQRNSGTFDIGLITKTLRSSVRIGARSGFEQDYFSAENLGSSRFFQTSAFVNYRFTTNMSIFTIASYRRDDFLEDSEKENEKDEEWQTGTGFNFSFLGRFDISAKGIYSERKFIDKKDNVWQTNAKFSFSFWRTFILSLEGMHTEQASTDPSAEFRNTRIMLRLTTAYPFLF